MNDTLIICRSVTHAQRISRLLQYRGVWNQIFRVPVGLVKSGCGYAVKVKGSRLREALGYLRAEGIPFTAVFVEEKQGYREVPYDLL